MVKGINCYKECAYDSCIVSYMQCAVNSVSNVLDDNNKWCVGILDDKEVAVLNRIKSDLQKIAVHHTLRLADKNAL